MADYEEQPKQLKDKPQTLIDEVLFKIETQITKLADKLKVISVSQPSTEAKKEEVSQTPLLKALSKIKSRLFELNNRIRV